MIMSRKILKKLSDNYIFVIVMMSSLVYCILWFLCYEGDVIGSDGKIYYQYFVRIFITHDFVNGGLIKYPLGTTLLQLPFLVLGLLVSKLTGLDLQEGMSPVFRGCMFAAAVFYAFLGVILIYCLLEKRCDKKVAAITCFCMVWGTMFWEYVTRKAGYSHVYGFFICTAFVYFVEWYESHYSKELSAKKRITMDFLLGILLGLVILVRNTNIIIGLVYLFYRVNSVKELSARLKKLFSWKILIQITGCSAVYVMQIICWKLQTGSWILYSYGNEAFSYLSSPKIFRVLFSDAKGLFIYSPVLIFSIIGALMLSEKGKEYRIAIWTIFVIQTYIISAWWCWWLGWGYGERMYCDILIIFAIPFADFLVQLEGLRDKMKVIYAIIYIFIFIFVFLNFMWMNGCHNGVISENMGTWNELHEQFQKFLLE